MAGISMSVETLVNGLYNRNEMKEALSLIQARIDRLDKVSLNDEEIQMIAQKQKIQAIKSVRIRCNLSLVDAKDIVDTYVSQLMEVTNGGGSSA